ncbi:MAG: Rhodanese-like domain-containing protein [uncultured Sulfurovum sp.]|uniref:Rhodanese-like domain-containing protein n=1 Tax=uncultured Sulfurovum sp. TaxID=269237 RepID=A0A6S6SH90_9BACT|nr:MAG: Rhodanese-like domain-containing protein [uncultured Sulfurovum sp.]
MYRYITLIIFLNTSLFANVLLAEVQRNGLTIVDDNGKKLKIDREKDALCTDEYISPKMLFPEGYAGKKVVDTCKKTFVTKIGVLQPMYLGKDIKTVGELEVLLHIKSAQESPKEYALIDARTEQWFKQMTIPSAINLPFNRIAYEEDKDEDEFESEEDYKAYKKDYKRMFKLLNVKVVDDELDFSKAKSLVVFCNGSWCSQSPNAIYKLVNMGYPMDKLLWYRGGLQDWLIYDYTVTRNN